MNSTEQMNVRLMHVDMHEYFLTRINKAMSTENYIEASWIIYSCLENRYFRTMEKLKNQCKYCRSKSKCNRKKKNELALKTKINCIKRLHENNVKCISEAFRIELFEETKSWVKKRNDLMHDLLSLDIYENTDVMFKESAEVGLKLLNETYTSCTEFRRLFYQDDYTFVFPENAMDACNCKPQEKKDE